MYNILAVDDAKDVLMLLEFDLSCEGYNVLKAVSGEEAIDIINSTEQVDLVLLDLYMPGISGLATLAEIKSDAIHENLPIIMLSASDDENEIVSALEAGANDYVTKPYIAKVLLARIQTSIRLLENTKQLTELSQIDFLTNINNRRNFVDLSNAAISQSQRTEQELAIVMLDIDNFKQVNDEYGHETGDAALVALAKTLKSCFRDYDIVGRIGGEEFAVCMPNIDIENAFNACERFRQLIEELKIPIKSHVNNESSKDDRKKEFLSITVTLGIANGVAHTLDFDNLMRKADERLYQGKNSGKNITIIDADAMVNFAIADDQLMIKNEIATAESEQVPINSQNENNDDPVIESHSTQDDEPNNKLNIPGIDHEIGIANVLGDESLFKEILVLFYQDHHQDGAQLEKAIATDDENTLKHVAHTLKGVACSVGAMKLFGYTKALDHAINQKQKDKYQELFELVSNELESIMSAIELTLADKL